MIKSKKIEVIHPLTKVRGVLTTLVNPFYESTGRFIVSPVAEYGELFLNSRFICLIKELMNEGITEDNYLDISKKISAKYTTKALKAIEYDFE